MMMIIMATIEIKCNAVVLVAPSRECVRVYAAGLAICRLVFIIVVCQFTFLMLIIIVYVNIMLNCFSL